jgi:hypothetical protein
MPEIPKFPINLLYQHHINWNNYLYLNVGFVVDNVALGQANLFHKSQYSHTTWDWYNGLFQARKKMIEKRRKLNTDTNKRK